MKKVSKVIENLNRLLKEDTTPISEFPTIVLKKLDIDGFSGKYKVKDKEIEFDVDADAEKALKALQKSMDKFPVAKEFKVKGKTLYFEPVVAESKKNEKKEYKVVKQRNFDSGKTYYTVQCDDNLMDDDDGNVYTFDSIEDAEDFIKDEKEANESKVKGKKLFFEPVVEAKAFTVVKDYKDTIKVCSTIEDAKKVKEEELKKNPKANIAIVAEDDMKNEASYESCVDFDKALELSGMDKLSFCQKVVGQNVRLKTDNANGSIGLVVNYDDKADKLIVKLGAENLISVQSKDVELLDKKEDNDKVTEGFKPTKDSTIGISRTGEFTCSYKDLVNLFGPPNSEGDGYKVSTEWVLKNEETGAKLTIYDYKMTELYDEDYYTVEEFRNLPSYEWHIGSRKKEDADTLIQYLSNNIKK
jgi:ribosomal protein S21